MKKFAFATTAVLFGLAQWTSAADSATDKTPTCPGKQPCCCQSGKECPPPCTQSDKDNKCGEEAWLDVETVTVEAENGNPIAQYTVAYLIETAPDATAEHAEKSKEWYNKALPGLEKAAAEGHPAACLALARMYADGKGVEKNPEMAEKYKKMYKELCDKKCKDKKECCPKAAPAETPAGN